MKKVAAAFVSIGVILVIVGLVLVGIYGRDKINSGDIFSFGSHNLDSANGGPDMQPSEIVGIAEINISVAAYDVYLLPSQDDVLSVKYVDPLQDGEDIAVDYANGTLKVTQTGSVYSHHWNFGWNWSHRFIAVYIPQNAQFAQVKVNVYADFSSIHVNDIDCGLLYVKTQAGSVHIDDIVTGDLTVDTSAGSVNVDNVECKDLSVNTDAGSINVKDITAVNSAYFTTGAGSVKCEISTTRLTIKSGAGSMKFETNASNIELHSGAGSIKGTVIGSESQYDIKVRNDVGSTNIHTQSVAGATKFLTVESDVGSINIKFDND